MTQTKSITAKFDSDGHLLLYADITAGWHRFSTSGRYGLHQREQIPLKGDASIKVQLGLTAYGPKENAITESLVEQYSATHPRDVAFQYAKETLAEWRRELPAFREGEDFPKELQWSRRGVAYAALIQDGKITISVDLAQAVQHTLKSGKRGVYDKLNFRSGEMTYGLTLLVIFAPPPGQKRGDVREWDLLPFVPGGLPETNRRRF